MQPAWQRRCTFIIAMGALCACACAQSSPEALAPAPGVPGPDPLDQLPSFGAALVRMVVTLAIVLGAGVGVLWLLRRRVAGGGRMSGKGTLRVMESCTLSPGHAVHLVKVGDQFVLVASSQSGVRALSDVILDNDALLTHYEAGAAMPAAGVPIEPDPARTTTGAS